MRVLSFITLWLTLVLLPFSSLRTSFSKFADTNHIKWHCYNWLLFSNFLQPLYCYPSPPHPEQFTTFHLFPPPIIITFTGKDKRTHTHKYNRKRKIFDTCKQKCFPMQCILYFRVNIELLFIVFSIFTNDCWQIFERFVSLNGIYSVL